MLPGGGPRPGSYGQNENCLFCVLLPEGLDVFGDAMGSHKTFKNHLCEMHGLVVCPSVPGSNPNSFLAPPLTDILSVTKKSLETSNFLVKNEDQKELNFHRISCSVTTWNRNDRHENQKHPSGPLNSVFFLASFSRSSWNSILCSTQMVLCPAKAIRTGSVPCVLRLLPDSCMVTGAAPCKQHPAKSADPEGQLRILGIQASDAENNSEFAIKYGKIIFFFLAKKSNWTGEL